MKQACKYNIIRFQPYAETQEFANIGVVIYVPKSGQFVFKLLTQSTYKRINGFFSKLDKTILRGALGMLKDELSRIQRMSDKLNDFDKVYDELVRSREGMIQYSDHFVRFTEDPEATADSLFQHYVHHSFTNEAGHEDRMRQSITQVLRSHQLVGKYKQASIGQDHVKVTLPFVHNNRFRPAVIKPIHFKHTDSAKLFEHGLIWLTKMEQLFKRDVTIPENVLFTYKAPVYQDGILLYEAYKEISQQIESSGIKMVDIENQTSIAEFARSH